MKDSVARKWLAQRIGLWRHLGDQIERHRSSRQPLDIEESRSFIQAYQTVQGDLMLAKSEAPDSDVTRQLQDLLVQANRELARPVYHLRSDIYQTVSRDVPAALQSIRGKLAFVTALMGLSILLGWTLVVVFPELASLFMSPGMIDTVQRGELWTREIFSVTPAALMSLTIMSNNIVVALTAFALGVFYGIGTFYIVVLNGMLLGSVFAYTNQYGIAGDLFEFVIAHGCVEVSVIVVTAAAGFSLGDAIAHPGEAARATRFRESAREGWLLCMFCIPFLVGAGVIEAYVSPSDAGLPAKATVGVAYWMVFVIALTGAWSRSRPIDHLHPDSGDEVARS